MRNETITIEFDNKKYQVEIHPSGPDTLDVIVDGQRHRVALKSGTIAIPSEESPQPTPAAPSPTPPRLAAQPTGIQTNLVSAPMPGDIVSIGVKPGDQVAVGQELLVLEAMKMKNLIRSPQEGTVASVEVSVGQSVKFGEPLVRFG